jgi:hypothetical protein
LQAEKDDLAQVCVCVYPGSWRPQTLVA